MGQSSGDLGTGADRLLAGVARGGRGRASMVGCCEPGSQDQTGRTARAARIAASRRNTTAPIDQSARPEAAECEET